MAIKTPPVSPWPGALEYSKQLQQAAQQSQQQPQVPTTAPAQVPQPQPQTQPQQIQAPQAPQAPQQAGEPQGAQDLVGRGFEGYQGWGDAEAVADFKATGGQGKGGPSSGGGAEASQPTINLPELYQSLYESSGISKIEEEYSTKEKQFIEAKGKINDNPFLSEATRVGRVAKLESLFAERTANLQRDIATKKADVETQLNLQTKQFDIESQAAQQAFSQLNTLLGMGALDNASGDTIANLTRSTGIGSEMILSAIEANKKKNVETQMITSTGENGEMFAVLLDSNTGEVIKKTSLGVIGNVQGGAGGETEDIPSEAELKKTATAAAGAGKTYEDMLSFFRKFGLSPKKIYDIYTTVGYYGRPPENVDEDTGEFRKK